MSLTPAEVRNVAFKRARLGKGGFDAEEVDAFLDEVERELARLIEENDELRARVRPGASSQLAAELADVRAELARAERERAAAEQTARAAEAELAVARGPLMGGDDHVLKMLLMAQRTADDHLADAQREADALLSEARSKAGELTRDVRAKAEAVERDAHRRHQAAVEGLDAMRTAVLKEIEELKRFERWYRSRLEAHLESQVQEVDGRGHGSDDAAH